MDMGINLTYVYGTPNPLTIPPFMDRVAILIQNYMIRTRFFQQSYPALDLSYGVQNSDAKIKNTSLA